MQFCLSTGDIVEKFCVALAVIAAEGPAVFEERLGGLFGIVEGVVAFPQVVFQNADAGAEGRQGLAVGGVRHAEVPCGLLGEPHRLGVGSVDGGQPFGQQAHVIAYVHGLQIGPKLSPDQLQGILFAGRAQQAQKIVPAAEFRYVGKIFPDGGGGVPGEPLQAHPEYLPLSQAAPDIPGIEQRFQGQVGILREGPHETADDLPVLGATQSAHRGKQIQTV